MWQHGTLGGAATTLLGLRDLSLQANVPHETGVLGARIDDL